ncbi:hypothetical protein PFISCL1PPCAC_1601, partial [Pristionchus fissidentatus]
IGRDLLVRLRYEVFNELTDEYIKMRMQVLNNRCKDVTDPKEVTMYKQATAKLHRILHCSLSNPPPLYALPPYMAALFKPNLPKPEMVIEPIHPLKEVSPMEQTLRWINFKRYQRNMPLRDPTPLPPAKEAILKELMESGATDMFKNFDVIVEVCRLSKLHRHLQNMTDKEIVHNTILSLLLDKKSSEDYDRMVEISRLSSNIDQAIETIFGSSKDVK